MIGLLVGIWVGKLVSMPNSARGDCRHCLSPTVFALCPPCRMLSSCAVVGMAASGSAMVWRRSKPSQRSQRVRAAPCKHCVFSIIEPSKLA